jgi:NTP pyrophosphatase (non-canonical NTP hydrolase)
MGMTNKTPGADASTFQCATCCAPAGQPCAPGCTAGTLATAANIAIGMLSALDPARVPLAVPAAIGVLRSAMAGTPADAVSAPVETWQPRFATVRGPSKELAMELEIADWRALFANHSGTAGAPLAVGTLAWALVAPTGNIRFWSRDRAAVERMRFRCPDETLLPIIGAAAVGAAARPAILKGIGKINGDGWNDTTRVGQVVFVWNTEMPKPYKAGQYPRIGNQCGWTASTDQYDFTEATPEEARDAIEGMLPKASAGLSFSALRQANTLRLPQFKNPHGELAHQKPDGSDWSPSQWLQALVGELGEFANVRKKFERGDLTLEQYRTLAEKELADVQTYLDLLARRALDIGPNAHETGVDLGEATRQKFNEVSHRVGADVFIDDAGKVYGARPAGSSSTEAAALRTTSAQPTEGGTS